MKPIYVFVFSTLFATLPPALAFDFEKDRQDREWRAKAESHCGSDERVVFTCRIKAKVVSVCASAQLGERGYVQYRYGARGNVELAIPARQSFKPSDVGYFLYPGASGREYYMQFSNGDKKYFVRYSSTRGDDDSRTGASTRHESAWVVVAEGRKKIFSRPCSSPEFDDNVGEHFWGKSVTTLSGEEAFEPYDE